jgi:hypothetical protein
MGITFEAEVIHWRGPAPYFFAPVPDEHAAGIRALAKVASYGWGVVPVEAAVEGVPFTTSLFPKNESYLLPLKDDVRRKAGITAGDLVNVAMSVRPRDTRGIKPAVPPAGRSHARSR